MSDPDHLSNQRQPALPRQVLFRRRYRGLAHLPLQRFAHQLSEQILGGREFACLITGDTELGELNAQFREKPQATDVLSFPAEDSMLADYAGDIAISVDHARAQAKLLGHSLQEEVGVLMLHGVLHLAGMDHERDSGAMRKAESRWRKHFALPPTLIARNQ